MIHVSFETKEQIIEAIKCSKVSFDMAAELKSAAEEVKRVFDFANEMFSIGAESSHKMEHYFFEHKGFVYIIKDSDYMRITNELRPMSNITDKEFEELKSQFDYFQPWEMPKDTRGDDKLVDYFCPSDCPFDLDEYREYLVTVAERGTWFHPKDMED